MVRLGIKNNFFLLGAHIGHFYTGTAHMMSNFVLGISHSFFVLNLEKSVVFYKKALLAASVAFSNNSRFLFSFSDISSLNLSIKSILINVISRSRQSFVYLKWIPGCITNFKTIFTKYLSYFMPELKSKIRRYYLRWNSTFNSKKRRNNFILKNSIFKEGNNVRKKKLSQDKLIDYISQIKRFIFLNNKFGKRIRISNFLSSLKSDNLGDWTPILSLFFSDDVIKPYLKKLKLKKKKKTHVKINSVFDAFESLLMMSVQKKKKDRDYRLKFDWAFSRTRIALRSYEFQLFKFVRACLRNHTSMSEVNSLPRGLQYAFLNYSINKMRCEPVSFYKKRTVSQPVYRFLQLYKPPYRKRISTFWIVRRRYTFFESQINKSMRIAFNKIKTHNKIINFLFTYPWALFRMKIPRKIQLYTSVFKQFYASHKYRRVRVFVPRYKLKRILRKKLNIVKTLSDRIVRQKKKINKLIFSLPTNGNVRIKSKSLFSFAAFLKYVKRYSLRGSRFRSYVFTHLFFPSRTTFFFEGVQRWAFNKRSTILPTTFYSTYDNFYKKYNSFLCSNSVDTDFDSYTYFSDMYDSCNFSFFSEYLYYVLSNQQYVLYILRRYLLVLNSKDISCLYKQSNTRSYNKVKHIFHFFFVLQLLKLFHNSSLPFSLIKKHIVLLVPILFITFFYLKGINTFDFVDFFSCNRNINTRLFFSVVKHNSLYFHFFNVFRTFLGSLYKLVKTKNKRLLLLFELNEEYDQKNKMRMYNFKRLYNIYSERKSRISSRRFRNRISKMDIKFTRRRKKAILPKFKWLFLRAITVTNSLLYNYEYNPTRDKDNQFFRKYFKKIIVLWKAIIFFRFFRRSFNAPDCLFLMNPSLLNSQPSEFNRLKLPVFGVADSNSNLNQITYPIPSNDDSVILLIFFVILFTNQCVDVNMRCKLKLLNNGN